MSKRLIKSIANILSTIFMILLILLTGWIIIGKMNNEVLFIGNHASVWVLTDSMDSEEGFPPQSYILLKKIKAKDVKKGDVIAFYSSDPTIKGYINTHRVVEIIGDNEQFKTKGDHNPVEDSYLVNAKDVIGVYVKRLPVLTKIGRFIATKKGFVCVIVLGLGLSCFMFLPDKKKDQKVSEEEAKEKEIKRRIALEVEKLKSENSILEQEKKNNSHDNGEK